MKLKDKVAIVTGSGQGIGLGIAKRLAEEGCHVVVSDLNTETCQKASQEIQNLGVKSIGIVGNISEENDVQNLVNQTIKEFGRIDILVNNAGVYPFVNFENMTPEDWDKVMNVNLKGIFLVTKYALKNMKEGSKVVNISSIASFIGFEGLVHYCTSKSGVNGFTRALALEIAPKKINVNAVAPGAIETPGANMTDETKNNTLRSIPLNRIGNPRDIANTVLFLASSDSNYITGQVITVDGGWTLR
jgi:3-oxoacyl-[acyl-carrier protein] reductase